MRHVPGILAGGFLVPGGNGLPDLYLNATDPADWVTMQIAARQPAAAPVVNAAAAAGQPVSQFTSGILPDWLTSPQWLENKMSGLAVKIGGMAIGLLIVGFALYYLSKD